MRAGYSNVLRDMVSAEAIPWKGCEALQVVCPFCREPLYVNKGSDRTGARDYLAHYPGSAADVEECELRVASSLGTLTIAGEVVARGQDLIHFLEVMTAFVDGVTPHIDAISAEIEDALRSSPRVAAHRGLCMAILTEKHPHWMPRRHEASNAMIATMAHAVGAPAPAARDIDLRGPWVADFTRTLTTARCAAAFSRIHRRAWCASMKLCLDHMAEDGDGHALAYEAATQMTEGREPDDEAAAAAFEDLVGAVVPVLLMLVDYPALMEARRNDDR